MSDNGTKKGKDDLSKEEYVKLAVELYRLADQASAASQDAAREQKQRRDWARQRLRQELGLGHWGDDVGTSARDHQWIMDVLDDIATYAQEQKIPILYEYLRDTQFLVQEILNFRDDPNARLYDAGEGEDSKD